MKRYPAYKDSGIEWIGNIPKTWQVKRLKFLCSLLNQPGTLNGNGKRIDLENIESWTGKIKSNGSDISIADDEMKTYELGDVLFNKLRPYLAKVYKARENGICGGELLVLRPGKEMRSGFVFYRTISNDFIRIVDGSTYGTKMPRAGWDFIGNLFIGYPDPETQEIVTAFLDCKTAQIDDLIAKKERMIELLKEEQSAVINQAVTRGLDPNVELKDSGMEWLGMIPKHWSLKRIKHKGTIRYGLGEPPEYANDGLAFVRATDIKKGTIDLEFVKRINPNDVPWSRRPQLAKDEILVVRSGAYTGDSAIVTQEVAGSIAGYDMVLTVTNAEPHFVAWALLSGYLLDAQIYQARMRAAQPHLNAEELGGFFVLIPPLTEQSAIAEFLDRKTDQIDDQIEHEKKSIELLEEFRIALISEVVTGKIDVRNSQ